MTPRPLTLEERRDLVEHAAWLRHNAATRHADDYNRLLAAEAYQRERAERLAVALVWALPLAETVVGQLKDIPASPSILAQLIIDLADARAVIAEKPKPVGLNEQHGKLQP